MARARVLAVSGLGDAGRAAAPWIALTALSLIQAWQHWRADFPFGTAGFCGRLSAPHCAWCIAAVVGLMTSLTVAAIELHRARRYKG